MKMMVVAGARPNFMKVASIVDAVRGYNRHGFRYIDAVLVHTGQHYDERMSDAFFRDLGLPRPNLDLGVGSGSHASQTAEIMKRFEPVLMKERPDVVVVVGDVNSTIGCSLVVSKMMYSQSANSNARIRPLLAHVEAGLRSFDRSMPEEINRILTDAVADYLFITERSAAENLRREGIPARKIHFVGNTMVDTLLRHRRRARGSRILWRLGLTEDGGRRGVREYGLVTLHRPSNVDNWEVFQEVLEGLATIGKELPLMFPMHPRTRQRIKQFGCEKYFEFVGPRRKVRSVGCGIHCVEPLGYLDFVWLMSNSKLVLTDSGGVQEETTVLGVPCVTLRKETERPVTIIEGTNVLAGTRKETIVGHAFKQLKGGGRSSRPKFWDGHAGQRIIKVLSRDIE